MGRSEAVESYFEGLEHPLKGTMEAVRSAILAADKRVTESIKWKSPTFERRCGRSSARGGNLASINPRAKQFVSLMFHVGAQIPGKHPALEGGAEVARYMRFESEADVRRQRAALKSVVKAWCDWKDGK